ncbi:MAG: protein-L-isoaspartate(D-aspartate) O-methyltransferase [Nitrospirae bacterium]|nr:protein-L-isoaspartate(D-aspartate) O-methyltransferase [Nitrospirota bacterium]
MDYEELRRLMVETQLVPRGIRDPRVLEAMLKVPRHLFVDEPMQHRAYDDMALPIGNGQTISQPYMVAVMTELLELKGNERVLEVGTGSGYQAAVLAVLAAEVYSIERVEALAVKAREHLRSLGYDNVHVITGDGTEGLPEKAPFDRIIITAGTPQVPEPLKEQLGENGILVAPVGARFSQQLIRLRKTADGITEEYHTPCVFVPLVGKYGWKE